MVDHPRLALGPRRLAIHSGSGRPPRQADQLTSRRLQRLRARRAEVAARVDRTLALPQFEMQLRLADPAGRTDLGDHLAAVNRVALFDEQLVAMGIGRDPAIGMLYENQIAVTAQLVAGV